MYNNENHSHSLYFLSICFKIFGTEDIGEKKGHANDLDSKLKFRKSIAIPHSNYSSRRHLNSMRRQKVLLCSSYLFFQRSRAKI